MSQSKKLKRFNLADDKYIETVLPDKCSKQARETALDIVNSVLSNEANGVEASEMLTMLLDEHKGEIRKHTDSYIRRFFLAVRFISYKKTLPVVEAYEASYPDKAERIRSNCSSEQEYKKRVRRAASAVSETNTIVRELETKLILPTYMLYSGLRNEAIETAGKIMKGNANKTKIFAYERQGNGRFKYDDNGLKIPILDDVGDHVYQEEYMAVSPKVQLEAAKVVIDATELPKEMVINANVSGSIETTGPNLAKEAVDMLTKIAMQQRDAVMSGKSTVDEVQRIGNFIDVKVEETDSDEEL